MNGQHTNRYRRNACLLCQEPRVCDLAHHSTGLARKAAQVGEFKSYARTCANDILRLINRLQRDGWQVELIYLALPNVGMSKMRVAERVVHGGHNIPLRDIERRFSRSLGNLFHIFSHKVDHCICFMNDGEKPILVFEQKGNSRDILHEVYYQQLIE